MLELALIAQVIVWLMMLFLFLASGQASMFHASAIYLLFHALVFVIRPILVYYLHFDSVWLYMGSEPSDADLIKTLAVSSVALTVFVPVNVLIGRARVAFPQGPAGLFTKNQFTALVATTSLLLPLALYSIRKTTGGDVTGQLQANGVYTLTNSTGYITDAQLMIAPLLCAWLLITRFHWLNLIPVVFYFGYRSWCGWGRFSIISFFIVVVLAYCWYHRKKWIPFMAIVLAIPILILFNILGHNRGYLQDQLKGNKVQVQDLNAGLSQSDKIRAWADTQDFANFDYLTFVVMMVPERTGTYTYGTQYLQLFTEPIPRILWKGKPAGAPVGFFNLNNYGNFTGLTLSLAGDGWMSGGWLGVVINMGVIGGLLGFLHRWYWRNINKPMVALFYVSLVAMLMQWYRDGGISISKFMFWNWLPFLVWLGMTWLVEGALVPGNSIKFRAGDRLCLIQTNTGPPDSLSPKPVRTR